MVGDAAITGDRVEILAIPDGALHAGCGFGEPHPGTRLALERPTHESVALQLQFALGGQLGQDAVVIGQVQREAPSVGIELRGLAGNGELNGLGEADFLGEGRGQGGHGQNSQRNKAPLRSHSASLARADPVPAKSVT